MMRRRGRLAALVAVGALIAAGCGDDDDSTAEPTETTEAPADDGGTETTEAPADDGGTETTEAPEDGGDGGDAWTVSTDDCVDPDAANEPIEGTVHIGSVLPLSNSPAAIAFSPVNQGLTAYFEFANENELLPGYEIQFSVQDDQYNQDLTPGAVDALLDDGVHLFTGIIGTPNNLAVRDVLNEECVPQLLNLTGAVEWGDVENYPWTTGGLPPYDIETKVYATEIARQFPDGATVGVFYVNSEFGLTYAETLEEVAGDFGIEIVETQTIEAAETAPPTAQVNALASAAPDVILAVPLGAQCPTFLNELANAKAANAGWEPAVFLTNTCASSLILAGAGENANGIYTSEHRINPGDPALASEPDIAEYIQYMTDRGNADVITTATAGWVIGEATLAILQQAAESPDGLTRASIINAARNLEFTPNLVLDGVVFRASGEEDPFYVESLQVTQYDVASQIFEPVGELVTDFES